MLQIAFSFNKFLIYDETRVALLNYTQVVFYLIDLLQDKNKEVQRVASACLDIVMDVDEEWAVRIRNLKFEAFNAEWLESVALPPNQMHQMAMARNQMATPIDSNDVDHTLDHEYTIGGQRVMDALDQYGSPTGGGPGQSPHGQTPPTPWTPGMAPPGYEGNLSLDQEGLRREYRL